MSSRKMSRRDALRALGLAGVGAAVAACAPQTVVVEKPVEVTRIVKETVMVEGKEVEVTKVVKETVIAPVSGERVALRFLNKWGAGVRRELMNGFLDQWAEEHPEIGIIFEPIADFDRRLPVLMAAGEVADIMLYVDFQMNTFHELTMDLTPLYEKDNIPFPGEGGDLIKTPRHVGWVEGHIKMIPFQLNIPTAGINKDLFEQAGVPMPWEHDHTDKWWDWYDYREAAAAINELGDDISGAIYCTGRFDNECWYSWTYSNGGQLFDVEKLEGRWNTPETIEAQSFAIDMICKDKSMLPWEAYKSQQASFGIDPFFAGKVGVTSKCELGPLRASNVNGCQVAWARSPHTGKGAAHGSMHFHVMSKDCQYPEQAWEFMKFLSNFDNQKKIALSGTCLPINLRVWHDADFMATMDPITQEAALGTLDILGFNDPVRGYTEWYDEAVAIWAGVMTCEKSVEEAVVEMDKMTAEVLQKHAAE